MSDYLGLIEPVIYEGYPLDLKTKPTKDYSHKTKRKKKEIPNDQFLLRFIIQSEEETVPPVHSNDPILQLISIQFHWDLLLFRFYFLFILIFVFLKIFTLKSSCFVD